MSTEISTLTFRHAYSVADQANRRAARYGVEGRLTALDVFLVHAEGSCAYCGAVVDLTLDHVIPMRLWGANALFNIVLACRSCNHRKAVTWERDIEALNFAPRRR